MQIDKILLGLSYSTKSKNFKFLNTYKTVELPLSVLYEGIEAYKLVKDIFHVSGNEARNLIRGKGIRINGHPILDEMQIIDLDYTTGNTSAFIISKGKLGRNYKQCTVKGVIEDKDITGYINFKGVAHPIFNLPT
jgi:tyrosyl-tRNA synthetase